MDAEGEWLEEQLLFDGGVCFPESDFAGRIGWQRRDGWELGRSGEWREWGECEGRGAGPEAAEFQQRLPAAAVAGHFGAVSPAGELLLKRARGGGGGAKRASANTFSHWERRGAVGGGRRAMVER